MGRRFMGLLYRRTATMRHSTHRNFMALQATQQQQQQLALDPRRRFRMDLGIWHNSNWYKCRRRGAMG
jgi:hypothetical protein